MSVNQYNFVTVWKIEAPIQEVWDTIYDTENMPNWWKALLKVEVIDKGDQNRVNAVFKQTWRGKLPYQLSLLSRNEAIDYLKSIEITASGDLEGKGKWTFTEDGAIVTVQYNWDVKTTQKYMSFLAVILKPLLAWNHDEIMRWGAIGLANKLNSRLVQY